MRLAILSSARRILTAFAEKEQRSLARIRPARSVSQLAVQCTMDNIHKERGATRIASQCLWTAGLLFVDALTRSGYRTHGIGKCHFTPQYNDLRGFETREIQEEGRHDGDAYLAYLRDNEMEELIEPHGTRGEMYYVPQVSKMPVRHHPTQWVGDRSIDFIKAQSRRRPWFLFSSFIHPHPPFCPPSPWHKLYRAALMPLPRVPQQADALQIYINRHQNRYKYRDQGMDLNLLRCMTAYYYACISFVDYQVGRILEVLESAGQLDNTLIVFASDHGEHLGDYNCFGKRSMHDSCTRIPLIARMPSLFDAGERCDQPTSLVDIAPTITAVAGAEALDADGVSLCEVASGAARRDGVFMQCDSGELATYAMVTPRWKYAYSAPDDMEFLFARTEDPAETRNRAGITFCDDALLRLRRHMIDFIQAGNQAGVVEGDGWKRFPTRKLSADPDAGLLIQDTFGVPRIPGYTCL